MTLTSAACPLTDVIQDQTNAALEGLVNDVADQLGLDAAVGPRQDHPRRPRAAARPRLQRLSRDARGRGVAEEVESPRGLRTRPGETSTGSASTGRATPPAPARRACRAYLPR